MALKAVDFFCGIGGATRGFLKAGIDVVAGIDVDITCKETYESNNKRVTGEPVKFFTEDITQFDSSRIKRFLNKDDKLIIIGCAPCQPFTHITPKLDGRKKERYLLHVFADIIKDLTPEYIFIENIHGLNSPNNKEILEDFLYSLKPEFNLVHKIVNASHYGIPQSRKRVIIFGKRYGDIEFPINTHGDGLKKIVTLRDVIASLPKIKAGEQHNYYKEHVCAKLNAINLERLKYQKNPGDGMDKWPKVLHLPSRKEREYKGHNDVYSRLWWDRLCSTLTTKFVSISNGRFAHPEQNRGLSILEGLIIQTFGKTFVMNNRNLRVKSIQIGNAVPVKLAKVFAKKILDFEKNLLLK